MAGEWFNMTAEFEGTTYMCTFDEEGQYQDISSNEMFYYHGGIIPELGDESGFYFLVFTLYDDYLVEVIPMPDVTSDNYSDVFDAMIEGFESSENFERLSEYHLERCARELMEENPEEYEDEDE